MIASCRFKLKRARESESDEARESAWRAHTLMATALIEKGLYDEALAHAKQAIELQPAEYQAYALAGVSLRRKGEMSRALFYYQKAYDLNPKAEPKELFGQNHVNTIH
jgi:tetratricopeptide (TPR) repeat protein